MIPRYSRPAMAAIWTEQAKYDRWLQVEIAVVRAWAEAGVIPPEDYERERATLMNKLAAITDPEGRNIGTLAFKPEEIVKLKPSGGG